VIDSRAPRVNQAVIGTLSLVAVLTGWWWLLALLALQLALGLTLGRRGCRLTGKPFVSCPLPPRVSA